MELNEDPPAFLDHYDQHKNALFNYLLYRVNFDRALAEDLFMDIVLKAYEHFSSFNVQKGSFKNWILAIAHNHLANHWRGRREALSLESMEEQGQTLATTKPNSTDPHEREQIEKVLALLNEEERTIIALRFLNELEFSEMADILDKREGAIRTQLSRALDRFKNHYYKLFPPSHD